MNRSSAYVTCTVGGKNYTYHFTGVTEIEHSLSLNLDSRSSQGTDLVNGARNQANRVTLSVVESDVEHGPGRAAGMLEAMAALKKQRVLCRVVTSLAAYQDMLLTEITAAQDAECQSGWSGTLKFTEYIPVTEEDADKARANSNSSVRTHTGTTAAVKISGTELMQLLRRTL